MAKILAIANQKGGVGKTTTTINLAASLAAMQKRLLLVDLDPQGNATMGSGVDKSGLERSVYDALTGQCTPDEAIVYSEEAGYAVLPGNADLTAAEVELMKSDDGEQHLKQILGRVADRYDYVLIDCPPSLNMLTLNALVAADGVFIPMQCEYFALEGLSALTNTIGAIQGSLNPSLGIEAIVRTMYDPRNKLTTEVSDQLRQHFGDAVYRTVIPRNVRLAEAPSYGLPVVAYDKTSTGARSYLALAGELLRRDAGQPLPTGNGPLEGEGGEAGGEGGEGGDAGQEEGRQEGHQEGQQPGQQDNQPDDGENGRHGTANNAGEDTNPPGQASA